MKEAVHFAKDVNAYLLAIEEDAGPRPGKRRTSPERRKRQIEEIDRALPNVRGTRRLRLMQARRDYEAELAGPSSQTKQLEWAFVQSAQAYAERYGIDYATWRDFGVAPKVLSRAGITPSGRNKPVEDTPFADGHPATNGHGRVTGRRGMVRDVIREQGVTDVHELMRITGAHMTTVYRALKEERAEA